MEWVLLHPFHLFYAHYHLLLLKKVRKIRPRFAKFHPKYLFPTRFDASRPKNSAICCMLHNFADRSSSNTLRCTEPTYIQCKLRTNQDAKFYSEIRDNN